MTRPQSHHERRGAGRCFILGGALFLAFVSVARPADEIDFETARGFWAFLPPREPVVPVVEDEAWARSDLDRFILSRLEEVGLRPAATADRRTLIRRVTLDLIGMPPESEEIEAFGRDESPDAWSRLLDRLLASPRYGERWGRHWLDVARYADSNGLDENAAHGNAWRYRDYVIAAWNTDKPFDRFVREQVAGDLLGGEGEARREQLVATGFLCLGPKVLAEPDVVKMEMDIIDEQIDTVGRAFLGLSLGCARCHDHKFDPIRTEDYYALAGIFKSTTTMESFERIAKWHENSLATAEQRKRKEDHDRKLADRKKLAGALEKSSDGKTKSVEELQRVRQELRELEKNVPVVPLAMGVRDSGAGGDIRVHIRGSHLDLGPVVPRGIPAVFRERGVVRIEGERSGRLELARWITDPGHPLTARVIVNRVWRWHFGRGLVRTADNFGKLGEAATNQPLLDWLALRLIDDGWSIKSLHRRVLLSATYRMGPDHDENARRRDPENLLRWRFAQRRLEAEAIRDSLLAVSGLLDLQMGGASLEHVKNRALLFDHTSKDATRYEKRRRSIYLPVVRNLGAKAVPMELSHAHSYIRTQIG